jgi:hypothetical protein
MQYYSFDVYSTGMYISVYGHVGCDVVLVDANVSEKYVASVFSVTLNLKLEAA